MKRKNKIIEKMKFFFLIVLFLSLVGGVLGLSVTVFLNQQKTFEEIKLQQEAKAEEAKKIEEEKKSSESLSVNEVKNTESMNSSFSSLSDISYVNDSNSSNFKIGEDISPGVYMLSPIGNSVGYYRVSATSSPVMLEILDNDVFSEITYVKLNDGEYLNLISSELISFEDINPIKLNLESVLNGRFLVGKDIEPGEYSLSPSINYGYVEITNSLRPLPEDVVKKSYFNEPLRVVLADGQFIKVSAAYLQK
ncbi:hypothetical protein J2Z35_000696 [Acetoanaerobium pronyense]|uniref:Uncharacterized protein n=1 Tax=Acetoanaerobium pronyense TaxID=1482736 RepID=A0ABS4KGK3_9FIRM|nr:hypothetical protein [Acetoanaerobium pronyense]MBP2026904.1 hypothetical protein [Acetoanaerobium pronyense]